MAYPVHCGRREIRSELGEQHPQQNRDHSAGSLKLLKNREVVAPGQRERAAGKFRRRPMPGEIPALALQFRQLVRTADREQRFSRQRKSKRTQAGDLFGFQKKFIVQAAEADRLQIEDAADREDTGYARFVGRHGREMSARRPACDDDPGTVESERIGVFPQPAQRIANLRDDSGQILFRRQCIYLGSATEIP